MAQRTILFHAKALLCKVSNTLGISPILRKIYFVKNKKYFKEIQKEGEFLPWITYPAILWLMKHIDGNMRVFEYGSGNSTLFFAGKVGQIVSVEYNSAWFKIVREKIAVNDVRNCDYSLHEPVYVGQSKNEGVFGNFLSAGVQYKNFSFKEYCKTITKFPDNYFDLVLVDGRARLSCLYYGMKKSRKMA